MKKVAKVLSLVLVLVVCFSVTALAVDPGPFSGNIQGAGVCLCRRGHSTTDSLP